MLSLILFESILRHASATVAILRYRPTRATKLSSKKCLWTVSCTLVCTMRVLKDKKRLSTCKFLKCFHLSIDRVCLSTFHDLDLFGNKRIKYGFSMLHMIVTISLYINSVQTREQKQQTYHIFILDQMRKSNTLWVVLGRATPHKRVLELGHQWPVNSVTLYIQVETKQQRWEHETNICLLSMQFASFFPATLEKT